MRHPAKTLPVGKIAVCGQGCVIAGDDGGVTLVHRCNSLFFVRKIKFQRVLIVAGFTVDIQNAGGIVTAIGVLGKLVCLAQQRYTVHFEPGTANTISSTYAQLAEQYGADVTGVDDLNQTFELLNSGRIDATLNAEVTFYDYTKEHPDANVKIAVLTQDANEVAIPLRKGDETATLREAINTAIDELRASGQLKDLSEKYFGTDISSND